MNNKELHFMIDIHFYAICVGAIACKLQRSLLAKMTSKKYNGLVIDFNPSLSSW